MKSILVVDDNLVSLKQTRAQLGEYYDVSLAKSGELALRMCEGEKPDLILLDMEMPGMDGFETLARLRQDEISRQIPVIFLTGSGISEAEAKGIEAGAMDAISKPADTAILRYRINMQLEYAANRFHPQELVSEVENQIGISFAELLGCKERNMAGHLIRVRSYVELLGKELLARESFGTKLSVSILQMISQASIFHDIGKIAISDMILLKRGHLTEMERREVCNHTFVGGRVLEAVNKTTPGLDYLKLAQVIAEGHHERYDGLGYPRGLSGDTIPLPCRIISVVNVYDACVSDRVYRKGLGHEETCKIILEGRGSEFDPKVVDVFTGIQEKFEELSERWKKRMNSTEWSLYLEANTVG